MPSPDALRADTALLTDLAGADVRRAWSRYSTPEQARAGLERMLPRLVETYGSAAASLAADWYDDLRLELGVPNQFRALAAVPPVDAGTDALAGWGIGPLYQAVPDEAAAMSLIEGGLTRRILNVSRDTITGSVAADPSGEGWQRVGAGNCGFCAMLIGRGAVYTASSVTFASHDNCKCSAAPAFIGLVRPVKPYTPTGRNITDADRLRVREYLAENPAL